MSSGTQVTAALEGNAAVVLSVTEAQTGLPVMPDEVRAISSDGSFVADIGPGGRIAGLFAGSWTLEVRAGERIGRVEVVELALGETRAVAVEVEARVRVAGSAHFADGSPASDLVASLLEPAQEGDASASPILHLADSRARDTSSLRIEVTWTPIGDDGGFELVAPHAGTYLVGLAGLDGSQFFSGRLSLAAGTNPIALEVPCPGSLVGQVEVPPGGSTLGLRLWVCPEGRTLMGSGYLRQHLSAPLEANGAFMIPRVAPGPARAFLLLPQPMVHTPGGWSSLIEGDTDLLVREIGALEIPSGEELEREFRLDDFPGTLDLTVLRDGVPVPGTVVKLRWRANEGHSAVEVDTDERGTYHGPLFPGNYDLVFSNRAQPGEDLVVPIVVQSARATVLTVSLDRP